jgi:hypothetical protein
MLELPGFFVPEQVKAWNIYIVVPPGVNTFDFIINRVASHGLTLLGRYYRGGKLSVADSGDFKSESEVINWNYIGGLRARQMFLCPRYHFPASLANPPVQKGTYGNAQLFLVSTYSVKSCTAFLDCFPVN